ncbi:MAG: peptidoglycan DD-metalloendopeptidase family protein, partial [Thermocrispum sp.]
FVSRGNGRGKCVKNNAASVWNRKSVPVTIFYKSNWAGAIDSFIGGAKANLSSALKNENAGHVVGKGSNERLEHGVYNSNAGRITSYFDGYLNTAGRHEGIDLARSSGSNVYSLLSGTVISKVEGSTNSLSTISIYNAHLNRSIIYLHTDPLVSVGRRISKGERIALEDNRAGGSPHTHVEMRRGRQTHASKSVGDPVLDNPNPTAFWMARGYNICCQ